MNFLAIDVGGNLSCITNLNIVEILEKRCGVHVTVENDAKCAALAEVWKGALMDVNDAIAGIREYVKHLAIQINNYQFILDPEKIVIGGAIAANQCEGACNEDGKGLSIQDVLPNGIKGSRTEKPTEQGLQFYDDLFDECHKYGIEPLVTLSHYEMPLYLAEKYDGWVNPKMIGFYENYVTTVFKRYNGKVKYRLTFNEINSILNSPFMSGGINTPNEELTESQLYQAIHHEMVASALAVKIAHEINPENQVGCMILSMPVYPLSPDPADVIEAMEESHLHDMFTEIHVRGEYPRYMQRYMRENNIEVQFASGDEELLKNIEILDS